MSELTNKQIAAGAAVLGDNGRPIGRNTAIMVADAMFPMQSLVPEPVSESAERTGFDSWAGIEYRNASHYTALEHDYGWAAWKARAGVVTPVAQEVTQQAAKAETAEQALFWPHGATEVACSSCGLTMGESRLLSALKHGELSLAPTTSTVIAPVSNLGNAPQVGCEGDDGLLRIHAESEMCDVCGSPSTSIAGLFERFDVLRKMPKPGGYRGEPKHTEIEALNMALNECIAITSTVSASGALVAADDVRDAELFRQMVDLGIQFHSEGRRDTEGEAVWADDVMLWTNGDRLNAARNAMKVAAFNRTATTAAQAATDKSED